jgi:hypothetical protein
VVLSFDGIGNLVSVGNYYDGGPGGNFGIVFSPNALGLVNLSAGGSGNEDSDPDGDHTCMVFLSGAAATMNVLGGFDTGFSFFHANPYQSGSVTVWSGLDGTGSLLATLFIPTTLDGVLHGHPTNFSMWVPEGINFAGTAHSVNFGGTENQIVYDAITIGSATPGKVPDSTGSSLLLIAALSLIGAAKLFQKQAS